jgi:hypothetical protein
MNATKYLFLFGGILIGLVILMVAGIGLLVLFLDEAGEDGGGVANFANLLTFPNFLRVGQENEGNEWFARVNNKYFMPFHTYLSMLALALAIVHLLFSSCPLNPFPEWGLIGAGILVVTGLIIKLRLAVKISPKLVKWIYQFHASLLVSGILVSILLAGHVLMD